MMDATRRAHAARTRLSPAGGEPGGRARGGLFVLSRGAEGPQVLALRSLLVRAGYPLDKSVALFDLKTAQALASFQRDARLDGTGRLDRLTQLALRAAVAAAQDDREVERASALLRRHAALLAARLDVSVARWGAHLVELSEQRVRAEADARAKAAAALRSRAEAETKSKEAAAARVRRAARAKAAARARILAAAKAYAARRAGGLAKALKSACTSARRKLSRHRGRARASSRARH